MSDLTEQGGATIQSLLDRASALLSSVSESARLDAEVLLCHCLGKQRSFLRAWPEQQLNPAQTKQFWHLLEQRRQGRPIAYLTGVREFWSRTFNVTPEVLIPRPDSELLIELSLSLLPDKQACKIIDMGTGSGILAITLAAERPLAEVVATDISTAALIVARQNAEQLAVGNVRLLDSDWFNAVTDTDYDLVVSNPPYIACDDPHLQQGDLRFEPESALISGEAGLRDIRLLAEQARGYLKPQGHLLIEHGYNQPLQVQSILKQLNYRQVNTHLDLSDNPRVTSGIWNPA
ncbi:MAG: peptide chain release factor N(5)-glutamine methyltransferase [Methylomonas sp.]|jgi:release factor glutamine methyltransferase|uniref:peptide chain release factor N(5)-glutamine methyltransferase n=1 Tax=Methylomonas sp. TaxID=418 RepID=UPI0025E4D47C|nr:peptide chain release factor N(5)-glutamine methyltransferase [Methylomonas sp.]MCK9608419.1 peptide chain release factor N(5)-glutamine methyltransferase [Methylomonas sp.]